MTRGIKLVFKTNKGQSVVDSNVMLTCDHHVYLAYCMVEAGMYGTMSKKHWSFAITSGDKLEAETPMYRVREDGKGHKTYIPRVPANALRGSFSALLLALETVAEQSGQKVDTPPADHGVVITKVATTVGTAAASAAPAVDTVPPSMGVQGVEEVIRLADGSTIAVTEWELCEGASDGALVDTGAAEPQEDTAQAVAGHDGRQQQ